MPQCAQTVLEVGPNLGAVLTAFFTLIGVLIGGYAGHSVTKATISAMNEPKA